MRRRRRGGGRRALRKTLVVRSSKRTLLQGPVEYGIGGALQRFDAVVLTMECLRSVGEFWVELCCYSVESGRWVSRAGWKREHAVEIVGARWHRGEEVDDPAQTQLFQYEQSLGLEIESIGPEPVAVECGMVD